MKCPKCGSYNVKVVDSRSNDTEVYRRRKCKDCNNIFYTQEVIDNSARVKASKVHRDKYVLNTEKYPRG